MYVCRGELRSMKMAIIDNGIEIHAGLHLDFGEVASRAHAMIEIIYSL